MTVRVTSLRGAEAGAYYVDPDRRTLATYYLDSGEPPGAWAGRQAAAWQLCGEVDASTFLALVDGRDPAGCQLGRRYGDESVRAYDITFSAPKTSHARSCQAASRAGGVELGHARCSS